MTLWYIPTQCIMPPHTWWCDYCHGHITIFISTVQLSSLPSRSSVSASCKKIVISNRYTLPMLIQRGSSRGRSLRVIPVFYSEDKREVSSPRQNENSLVLPVLILNLCPHDTKKGGDTSEKGCNKSPGLLGGRSADATHPHGTTSVMSRATQSLIANLLGPLCIVQS